MLELTGLTKRFDAKSGVVHAVNDVSLVVEHGELVSLLGPSGCGKTTTLRLIAGFETPTAGTIRIAGDDVSRLPPQKRGTGMVFQNYALFPHLNVYENVAFGLRTRGTGRADTERRVSRALELVDLAGYGSRRVQELSGGQQQRVALARALAPEPPLLLLDEPLSNLDAALRERTRGELRGLLKQLHMTAVFVTHDQEEAFALADRIALLDFGRLQQYGTPDELYREPANTFTASFIGRANFIAGTVEAVRDGQVDVRLAQGERWTARPAAGTAPEAGAAVRLMVRPESLAPGDAGMSVRVVERRFAGPFTELLVDAAGTPLMVHVRESAARPGDIVKVTPTGGVLAFPDA